MPAGRAALAALLLVLAADGARGGDAPSPRCVRGSEALTALFDASRIRAVMIRGHEHDAAALDAARGLGANTVVLPLEPDPETARLARERGLFYLAWLSTDELARSEDDAGYAARLAAVQPLAGLYYEDDSREEGFADAAVQERAYRQARRLFPCALVLHPTRLDPVSTVPGFLRDYFRPEFTDLVVPYFYPVGTTVLGTFAESGPWEPLLASLLSDLAAVTPPGKGLLPVLQGFEQIGFPVSERFLAAQMSVYASVFPGTRNAAIFEWGVSPDEGPLVGFSFRPALWSAVGELFASVPAVRVPRALPARR